MGIWDDFLGWASGDDSDTSGALNEFFYSPKIEGGQYVYDDVTGKLVKTFDPTKFIGVAGAGASLLGLTGESRPPVGYQGRIPDYTATRSRVANTYDPTRRAGSGGQRYFSDTRFTPNEITDDEGIASANPAVTNARLSGDQQALGLEALNLANLARQTIPTPVEATTDTGSTSQVDTSGAASGVVNLLPAVPDFTGDTLKDVASKYVDVSDSYVEPYSQNAGVGRGSYAAGGIAKLREGRYLAGATDGMADKIPAEIDQVQPAALSDGEYVIPADVVSHLGNGNSDAGAEVLDKFLTKVRKSRTGNGKQGTQIDPNKLLPKVA